MTVSKEIQPMADAEALDLQTYLVGLIREAIRRYLAQEGLTIEAEQLSIDMRLSAQASFGDYSVPAMPWSGKNKLGRPPMLIAEALAEILRALHNPAIAEITVTKPGFLNFRLDRPTIGRSIIEQVLAQGSAFGQGTIGQGTKVVVEHTAINSNKAAHAGHLRNSCIGDTVVRILRAQGYNVEAQNYIDDSGVQVADVVVGFTLMQQGKLDVPGGNQPQPGEAFDYFCSRVYVAVGSTKNILNCWICARRCCMPSNMVTSRRAGRTSRRWPAISRARLSRPTSRRWRA